jgi:hypothetical protein
LVPLGLMAVPGTGLYIGQHFRVETPFESQSYSNVTNCISQWALLVPPLDANAPEDPMQKVRLTFQPWIDAFSGWTEHATVYSDLGLFTSWLRGTPSKPRPNAILILSHHDSDRIYFEEGQQDIESANVLRSFDKPSLVILNGCGTAKPGASDFLRSFNQDGVSTAIATSYAVDARMAGLFTKRLMDFLALNGADPTYNVGRAKFDAAVDVSKTINPDTNQAYGPRALVFTLVGDGGVKACVPQLHVQ